MGFQVCQHCSNSGEQRFKRRPPSEIKDNDPGAAEGEKELRKFEELTIPYGVIDGAGMGVCAVISVARIKGVIPKIRARETFIYTFTVELGSLRLIVMPRIKLTLHVAYRSRSAQITPNHFLRFDRCESLCEIFALVIWLKDSFRTRSETNPAKCAPSAFDSGFISHSVF